MIPLMKSTFLEERRTKQALADFILSTNKLSMGEKCAEFEKEFAHYQGRRQAVLFNSGGSANLAILQALRNLGRLHVGDRTGFSSLTWSTNVMPIIQMGMIPVVVDCRKETLNIHLDKVREVHDKKKLQALFVTNALGFCGDLDKIKEYCKTQDIILLEDNCESLGSELPAGKVGNFGLASSFSFFVAHHMSTVEGGMVCTDDGELDEMLRIVRANGWDRNLNAIQQKRWRSQYGIENEFQAKYAFYDLGYNLRPTEMTGFLGLFQMQFLDENIKKREENYLLLEEEVRKNDELILLDHSHMKRLSSFAWPVLCKTKELREKYFRQFAGAGVEIRPVIAGNIQRQPFYQKYVKEQKELPGADFIHECGLYCGNYPELTASDLEVLKSCLKAG